MSGSIQAPAIDARGITRVYKAKPKDVTALAGIDLEVVPGEFFGLLGPNGAGKTTLIKILTTLLLPSSGTARIFGFDVATETKKIRRIMNMVAGGEQSGYGILEASEQLWMFSQFYGLGAREGWRRVDELIDAVGLGEQRHQRAWAVLDDRERYRMLKYIYVSPSSFLTVLIGRGVARLAVGAMGAGITLAVGVIFLGVPFDLLAVDWPLLVVVLVLGVITISALALVMAAICLQTRQESWDYPEVVVGALFLVVGAVFPLSVLPLPLQVFGLISPLTWWIAGVRQALFPGGPSSIGGPGSLWQQLSGQLNPTAVQVVVALLVTGAVVTLASAILFRSGEERAKDRGLIDRTTGS